MPQDAQTSPPPPVIAGERPLAFGDRTLVMGILNLTDDSFSGDGLGADASAAVEQALRMADEGADILDIGAESTRPGSEPVTEEAELARLIPVIEAVRRRVDAPLSVDTSKPAVARRALEAGADIINDVAGLRAPGMIQVAAEARAPVIIMHMLGAPRDMQRHPQYEDVVADIKTFLAERIATATAGGIAETQIIVDPGFGFGKTAQHNLELVRRLGEFCDLGRPVLIGPSRKSTIGLVLDLPPEERIFGTAAACAAAICNGAHIIRVHDVRQMAQVARMTDAILGRWHES